VPVPEASLSVPTHLCGTYDGFRDNATSDRLSHIMMPEVPSNATNGLINLTRDPEYRKELKTPERATLFRAMEFQLALERQERATRYQDSSSKIRAWLSNLEYPDLVQSYFEE
jgi:hypothetical protein